MRKGESEKRKLRRGLWTHALIQVVTHRGLRLGLIRIVDGSRMTDALLVVRSRAIGWFVSEDAGLVDQFVIVSWVRRYIVES